MNKWNPTFRGGYLPPEWKKHLRAVAVERDQWSPYRRYEDLLPDEVFDHWGVVRLFHFNEWALIAQPYNAPDFAAHQFAAKYRLTLAAVHRPAPWAPGATLYAYSLPRAS